MNTIGCMLRTRNLRNLNKFAIARLQSTNEDIVIPKRIQRGPTDILRALEGTIKRDPTAAHYKYHDDPYLIPMSNIGKRTFSMAQEAGRKAAHWVRQQHPDLFQHRECDPPIEPFFPKMVYNEQSDPNEMDLNVAIKDVLVSNAITVYKLLKTKGVEISQPTLLSFLDLLCFYNNKDTLSEEFIEERWFRQSTRGKEKQRKTWRDGAIAEEIFIGIENPDSGVYSAIIQGMGKHFQVDRSWQLFQEAQGKGLILSADAYNAMISISTFLKENYDMRWTFVMDIMTSMEKAQVRPNLGTLNAALEVISTMGVGKNPKQHALRMVSEFRALGIEPSLASWYFVLITHCKERGPVSCILRDMMQHVENREHPIRDIKDTFFFVTAMEIARNHLHDKDLAQRIHKLLNFGNNYDLIGDSYKESIYYRHYFILMCETEPLDEFMENMYYKYVPHIYVPEPMVMGEILKTIELNAAVDYLPKLWSDMIVFDHIDREELNGSVLTIMVDNEPESGHELHDKFANIAWSVWNKIENQSEHRIKKLTFTGEMLGAIMTVVLRNGDFEKACLVMDRLDQGLQTVAGIPKIETMSLFIDRCVLEKAPSKAIQCIQYCADCGFAEAEDFATRISKNLTLDETHLRRLVKIVGEQFVEVKRDEAN